MARRTKSLASRTCSLRGASDLGDSRFEPHYAAIRDRTRDIREFSDTDLVFALAAASRERDPLLANIIATESHNRIRRLGAITHHMAEAVLGMDQEGRVFFVNPAAERMLQGGLPRYQGKPLHDTLHPQCDEVGCGLTRVLTAEDPRRQIRTMLGGNGGTLPIEGTLSAIVTDNEVKGSVFVFRDITEELEAASSRSRLAAVVDSAAEAIFMSDGKGHIQTWNAASARIFHRQAESAKGMQVHRLFTPDMRDVIEDAVALCAEGHIVRRLRVVALRAEGASLDCDMTVSPYWLEGSLGGLVFVVSAWKPDPEENPLARASGFKTIVDGIKGPVIVLSREGAVEYANPAAHQLLDVDNDKNLPKVLQEYREAARNREPVLLPGREILATVEVVPIDWGATKATLIHLNPLDAARTAPDAPRAPEPEPPREDPEAHHAHSLEYVLYVSGDAPTMQRAKRLASASARRAGATYRVFDVRTEPDRADAAGIVATPTLIRNEDGIETRVVGSVDAALR